MVMRNHGLLVCGETVGQAFVRMFRLERACQVQIAAQAGGAALILPSAQTCEESGRLGQVMEQIAPYYKEKMEGLVNKVSKLLEPLIIVFMGSTIAGLMLAIYMPMFEMAGKVN